MQLYLLILFHYFSINYCSNLSGFNLYHTNRVLNGIYRDCLYYYVPQTGLVSQLIQYCIRFQLDEELTNPTSYHQSFTFEELRKSNVTSFQLYMWSAPIDIIEHYQSYLENVSSTNTFLYYNCTYPWFGSRCEYTFDYPHLPFTQQVEMNFDAKDRDIKDLPKQQLPCYMHLKCNRVSKHGKTAGACLDWREICDGKIDCIDGGHDEEQCWQLEINECDSENEFRCHNGLCIPLNFLDDDNKNADCLDRTDEIVDVELANFWLGFVYQTSHCSRDPTSRCEDHVSHPLNHDEYALECGDGGLIAPKKHFCANGRELVLIDAFFTEMNVSNICRSALYCLFTFQWQWLVIDRKIIDCNYNNTYDLYATLVKEHCPSLVEFPPILFGHVHLVYTNDHFLVSNSFQQCPRPEK